MSKKEAATNTTVTNLVKNAFPDAWMRKQQKSGVKTASKKAK